MIPPSIPIDPHRYEMQQSQQTKKDLERRIVTSFQVLPRIE
ncbi:hypothetical protein BIFADO_02443 [Bifidobacterium adolescentis L2-32]|uniref:Uncharacterized protein n=1 Tax=Bifidobacterium adolescentis L2-32 TaxID=411481 RepID=A7A997_BIFAD|nr:hypothetical protein BIFADO_02443 [Bifidobacterium adolescentis L2-32]